MKRPDSDETKAWVEAQNQVTFSYLNEIPVRSQIKQSNPLGLREVWDSFQRGRSLLLL